MTNQHRPMLTTVSQLFDRHEGILTDTPHEPDYALVNAGAPYRILNVRRNEAGIVEWLIQVQASAQPGDVAFKWIAYRVPKEGDPRSMVL